jgi:hypothetical protein
VVFGAAAVKSNGKVHPGYMQPLFEFKSEKSVIKGGIEFAKLKQQVESKDRGFKEVIKFDLKYYAFAVA